MGKRVLRGGGWANRGAVFCPVAYRNYCFLWTRS